MALFVKRGATKTNIGKEQELNSQIWATGIPGQANNAKPVMIRLKDPINFSNIKQYYINSETWKGLHKIITIFLGHELLVAYNSLFNILILLIRKKKNGTYRLVQDSSTINDVVIPIHTVVPNLILSWTNSFPNSMVLCTRFKRDLLLHFFWIEVVNFYLLLNRKIYKDINNN